MKCPKCGYLGFEPSDRCRNCGYDFSLAVGGFDLPDLPLAGDSGPSEGFGLQASGAGLQDSGLRTPDVGRPVADTGPGASDLGRPDPDPGRRTPDVGRPEVDLGLGTLDVGRSARGPREDSESSSAAARADGGGAPSALTDIGDADLPLLPGFDAPDVKLVKASRQPRAPLAVRRATPEFPRFRSELRTPQSIDFSFAPEPAESKAADETSSRSVAAAPGGGGAHARAAIGTSAEPASAAHRLLAAVIDLTLLAGLDLLVLYFTLRICGLTIDQLSILPIVPLIGFFVVLNGGYLAAFTAGGQTIGKMALGIRIVGEDEPLSAGRAILRTLCWGVAAVPAGLGFLSIFINPEHRGLHDRFARTRVILAR